MGRVDGKIALVTGGVSGIGLATAELLADEGAKVILSDLEEPRTGAAATLAQRCRFYKLDVTRENEWIGVADAIVSAFGRLDILVNSAGVSLLKDIEATTLDEWRHLMAVNLDGTFLGCKHAIRVMKDRSGGSIVNMSSVAGLIGTANLAAYGASKGGIVQLTRSLATAWAADKIQVNAVLPGWVDTDLTRQARKLISGMHERVLARTPAGRWGDMDDFAGIAVFLASAASDFVTGTAIPVDGGYSVQA